MMGELVSLLLKMQLMTGVISRSYYLRNVVQPCAIDWKEMLYNTRGYWIEICSGIPMKEWTISKDFYDLISSKVPRTCSYTVSCSSWSTTEELWIFRSGWLDFNSLATDLLSLGWIYFQKSQVTSPEAILFVQQKRQEHERDQQERAEAAAAALGAAPHVVVPWSDELALVAFRQYHENRRQAQRQVFPLGENLLALIFVSLADLTQDQRNTLTSIMTHRGRTLEQYNIQELRDLFLEMFCTTKTAVDNPLMQPSGMAQRRSFLVLDEGDLEGIDGYWAEDEEDGAEGFLDALEDVFWVYDDANFTWYQRRFQGKQIRRGKGKGKRKGKGKGRGGRRFFRSRKGKGRGKGRRKGRQP